MRMASECIKPPEMNLHLAKIKLGDRKKLGFHQWEDWGAFALNL